MERTRATSSQQKGSSEAVTAPSSPGLEARGEDTESSPLIRRVSRVSPRRRGKRLPWGAALSRGAIPWVMVAAVLLVWEFAGRTATLKATLPPFSVVAAWLANAGAETALWADVGQTMLQWGVGLAAGSLAGIILGLAIGFSPILRLLLDVVIEFLRPIPAIVYLPLLILLYGNTDTLSVVNVAVGILWILLFQTYYGTRSISTLIIDTGRVFGLSVRQRLIRLVVPSVAPYIATGVRIASSTAFLIAVSVELIGGAPGLGLSIEHAETNGQYPAMYGYVLMTGLVAVIVNAVLVRIERSALGWHVAVRAITADKAREGN